MIDRLRSFLFTNVKALQAFHLMRQGAALLIAVLLTKTGLETGQIGTYEMLLYLAGLVSAYWIQGLIQGLLSEYPRQTTEGQQQLVVNAYGLFVLLGVLIGGGMILAKPLILPLLSGQPQLDYYELFFLYVAINFPAYLLENFFLLWHQPQQNFLYGILSFLPMVAVVILPPALGMDFTYSFYGLIGLAVVRHLFLLYHVWRNGRWHFRPDLLLHWCRIALPLVLYAFLGGVNQSFDSWLVGQYYDGDETQFAIFRYGARELPLVMALAAALGTAMVPRVAEQLDASLGEIRSKSLKLFHFLFPLSIVLMITSRWLFPLVFNADFRESVAIFNIFLLVIVSRLIFSRTVLVGLQDNQFILLFSLLELVANVLISWWLIREMGLVGVAWGTLLAITLEKVLLCLRLYLRFGIGWQQYTDLRWWGWYSGILIMAFLLSFQSL